MHIESFAAAQGRRLNVGRVRNESEKDFGRIDAHLSSRERFGGGRRFGGDVCPRFRQDDRDFAKVGALVRRLVEIGGRLSEGVLESFDERRVFGDIAFYRD